MKRILIHYNNPELQPILEAVNVLNRGGAVIYPTDTVYGLAVSILREDAIERLFKIKKRPSSKPVPIIVRDIAMVKKFAFVNSKIEKVLNEVWPGPVTVVLEKKRDIPVSLTGGRQTIGMRIPDCPVTKLLMEHLEWPITATSANFSGEPSLNYSMDVRRAFETAHPRPDLFLDAGDLPNNTPSTILDLTGSRPKILRVGPVSKEDLLKMFK